MTVHDADPRQELLGRIRTHQANINTYVGTMRGRRALVTNISIVSSAIAAALMVGPTTGGPTFTQDVQNGLGWRDDSSVWKLLCLTALIVNVVAVISAQLGKSHDPTERIVTAEVCNAALEELGTDVEFGNISVKIAAAEYGKLAAKILFISADPTDDADAHSNNGAPAPPPSRTIDRYRRSAEVVMPGMAIVFGCFILALTMFGLGKGVATAAPTNVVLPVSQIRDGDTYSATAQGFSPGEIVKFTWNCPTPNASPAGCPMADAPRADSGGSTTLDAIQENAPPGYYTLTATGQASGRIAWTGLQILSRDGSAR
ncbi:MAG: hypothetical protein ACRDR6_12520 [Pseudonocardiaceae bacterium]